MKILVLATTLGAAGLAFAQSKVPVATVASSAPITVQGVEAPVVGSTAWPVTDGDVIRTSSAPAEVRLKDGTRIFVPPSSRFVVGSALPASNARVGAVADLRVRAVAGAPAVSSTGRSSGILSVLDGGAMVINDSTLQQFAAASSIAPRNAPGDTPASIDLASLINTYGANNPVIGVVATALNTPGVVITSAGGGNVTITLPSGQGAVTINGLSSIVVTTPTGGTTTTTPPPPGSIAGCKGGTGLSATGACQ